MNRKTLLLAATGFVAVTAQAQLTLTKAEKKVRIEITNPSADFRKDEPVTVAFPEGKYRSVTVFDGKKEIASQADDLNQNGMPDELAFVIDLKGNETKMITLTFDEKQAAADRYPARVHAQMFFRDKKTKTVTPTDTASSVTGNMFNVMQHHGPAFESELVAYRLYFDKRQTVDLYGKYNPQLELAATLWYPNDQQLANGFGDDILLVGNSVGIGTLKGWVKDKAVHLDPVKNRQVQVISKGPVRTIVDMNVTGWAYQGKEVDVKSRYILFAGQRECQIIQQFTSPGAKDLTYTTGVMKKNDCGHISDGKGMTAMWGTDWPVNDTVKFAKQTVGMAVEIPQKYLVREMEDPINYLYEIRPDENGQIEYRMTFCAEKENFGVKTAEAFFDYVNLWKEKQPVRIRKK